ncbi:MAG: type 4a pilus biogenesis protein PilO [Candidatus Latescibacteria bacterium]|nr:type 4a pilus biogenesis protein PilO [Candidatus Latescibacterota bacterium]
MYKGKLGIKHWVLLGVAVYLIGVNLLYFLLLKPVSNRFRVIKTQKSVGEDLYLLNATRQAVKEFRGRLVKPDELKLVRRRIIDIARRYNITLLSIAPPSSEEKIGWGLAKIPIKVQLQGGYHDIGSFISRLESWEKLFVVDDLHIFNQVGKKYNKAEFTLYTIKSVK